MKLSLPSILLILFILLKIFNVITWSWIWILSPLWIPLAVFVIIGIFSFVISLLYLRYK